MGRGVQLFSEKAYFILCTMLLHALDEKSMKLPFSILSIYIFEIKNSSFTGKKFKVFLQ